MSASSTRLPTPEGPGSVSGAPQLAEGFTDTFTSRYVDTADLRLHAVTGGDDPPLLLAALTAFLTRTGTALTAAHDPGPRAAGASTPCDDNPFSPG